VTLDLYFNSINKGDFPTALAQLPTGTS